MNNIIFDFDGVLGDTDDLFARFHQQGDPDLQYEEALQRHQGYFFNTTHSHRDNPTQEYLDTKAKWLADFMEFAKGAGLLPVPLFNNFIAILVELDIPNKAVVSSGTNEYLIPALNTTKLNPSHILGFEDHHSKEEKIAIVCKDWGVNPKDTIYFTDTISDVIEVQDMVDIVIGCAWGTHNHPLLSQVLPEHQILDNFEDIYRLFQ
jgi:phosphoglycolate phosphatase-like HAD superfamily hydrolase